MGIISKGLLRFRDFKIIEQIGFTYLVVSTSITSSHQDKKHILSAELVFFLRALSKKANPLKLDISQKERIRIALKYFLLTTYYLQYKFS